MTEKLCIFCGLTNNCFDKEHVIPAHLHGCLWLEDTVCKKCNGILGNSVDHGMDCFPEVLRAAQCLGLDRLCDNLHKHRFKASVELEDGSILHARHEKGQFVVGPQKLGSGHMFWPAHVNNETMERHLRRKASRRGIATIVAKKEIPKIINRVKDAKTSEIISSDVLDVDLVKGHGSLKCRLEPRSHARPWPLVAKIAYEILFLFGYRSFFDCHEICNALLQIINGNEPDEIVAYRKKSESATPIDRHRITFCSLPDQQYPYFEVSFFGCIDLVMLIPMTLPSSYWRDFDKYFSVPNRIGVTYEQTLIDGENDIFIVLSDGREIPISMANKPELKYN